MGNKELEGEHQSADDLLGSRADKPTEQQSRGTQRGGNIEHEGRGGGENAGCHLEIHA